MKYELQFSVKPPLVGRSVERLRQLVIGRANGECEFCGVKGFKKLSVVYGTDSLLVQSDYCAAACAVCYSINTGGLYNEYPAGTFLYFPELSQAELVGVFYSIEAWRHMASSADRGTLNVISAKINKRRGRIREMLGSHAVSVEHWNSLLSSNSKLNSNRSSLLSDFKFMPDKDVFADHLEMMKVGVFNQYNPRTLRVLGSRL